VQFPAPSQEALDANPGADPLMLSLAENTLTPLEDPGDSSRLVPMVLRVPGELVEKVQHLSFASQLQKENQDAREACIRRLALGLDMPPEELLGKGDVNHWGSWQIAESGVKLHVAPKLTTVVSAINEAYYEPALEALGLASYAFTLWYDVSELTQRPDRSADATTLYNAGELSAAALRTAMGFGDSDAPSHAERVTHLLEAAVRLAPATAPALLPSLMHLWAGGTVETMPLPSAAAIGGAAPAAADTGEPGASADETRGTPATQPGASSGAPAQEAA